VSLTRSRARTDLPGHTDAIGGKHVSNYPTCAHIVDCGSAVMWSIGRILLVFILAANKSTSPSCVHRPRGLGGWRHTVVLYVCCLPLRRVVLTRATGRDAAFFEAGLDRYRPVDMLICRTTHSVCHVLVNDA